MKKRFKIKPIITILLVAVLFLTGCVLAPEVEDSTVEEYAEDVNDLKPLEQENLINSTFSIRYLDMGQADSTLIECDSHYMLIDGGKKDSSSKIYTILKNNNIDYLDIIVGTHPDEDHIGGLAGALNYATARMVLCPTVEHDTDAFKDFAKYAEQNGNGIIVPEIGDVYPLGSAKVTILGVNGGTETNDTSIVLKIQYGETSFLFSGDAEGVAEEAVLNSGVDLSATVLQVGHHGSADSTTEAFLNEVMPAYAIISVGAQNTYLHPTEEVLERLERAGAEIYRTDLQGEIEIISDGKTIDISTEREASVEEIMLSGEAAAKMQEQTRNQESTNVVAPSGTDYILNTNTKKFHYSTCKSVKQMKAKNTAYYTGTRDEVIAKGYDSCGNCHP